MRKATVVALISAAILAAILGLDVWVHGPTAARLLTQAHIHPPHPLEHPFWDTEPYAAGIADFRAHRSPYHADDLTNPLPFAYPPAFAWAGAALANLLTPTWGWRLYLLVYFLAVFGMQMLFATIYLHKPTAREALALLCLLPLAPLLSTAFLSGNIHVLWYFAGALAAVPGLSRTSRRRNQWLWFYLVIAAGIVNQPVFAAMLLLPLLAGTRQYLAPAATVIIAALAYAAEFALNPPLYRQFQQTVAAHLAVSHDFGQGLFGILMHFSGTSTFIPAAIQILFSVSIVALLFWLKSRGITNSPRWWALIALAIILVNPRVMPYDAAQALIPAIYFIAYNRRRGWLITLPVALACVAAHSLLGFTPVILAGFLAGAISLLREPISPVQSIARSQSPQQA